MDITPNSGTIKIMTTGDKEGGGGGGGGGGGHVTWNMTAQIL